MLRRAASPALWNLRTYWGTAVLLAVAAIIGVAALLPVTALFESPAGAVSPRLGLAPWRGGDLGMGWSSLVWSPTATHHAGLLILFRLLFGVAVGVLAVAVLTIISLAAARVSDRAPDVRLRRAVGASQWQVLAAETLETGAMAAAALVLGSALGTAGARAATEAWAGSVGPGTLAPTIVAVVATLGGVMLGGLLPQAFPRRTPALPGARGKPLELFVPALQLGLSLTVLTAAGLLQREARWLLVTPGATSPTGQVFAVTAPHLRPATRASRYGALLQRLRSQHVVDGATLTSPGTLVGLGMVDVVTTDCGNCWQGGIAYQLHPVPATHYLVSADTFRVLGLPVVAGRGITGADCWGADPVAVVNRSLATHHFQGGAGVGRHILVGRNPGAWHTVVGVVDDRRRAGFGAGLQPPSAVYLSVLQHPSPAVDLLVGAPADSGIIAAVDQGLRDTLGAGGTGVGPISASQLAGAEAAPLRWFADMFGAEGWVILSLATLGAFVVMHLWVLSLRYELGIRRAVGARRRAIFWFVLARAAGVATGGMAIGLWAGLVVWGALATVVVGLPAWDVRAALSVSPLLVGATLAGALVPAWRATQATPTTLLGTGS